ncbi:MAG: hypothetical protein AAGF45_09725 [Pseudomonadota bacterium]
MPLRLMAIVLSAVMLNLGAAQAAMWDGGGGLSGLGAPASTLEQSGTLQGGATLRAAALTAAPAEQHTPRSQKDSTPRLAVERAADLHASQATSTMGFEDVGTALYLTPLSVALVAALATLAAASALYARMRKPAVGQPLRAAAAQKAERIALWVTGAALAVLTVADTILLQDPAAASAKFGPATFQSLSSAAEVLRFVAGWCFTVGLLAFFICAALEKLSQFRRVRADRVAAPTPGASSQGFLRRLVTTLIAVLAIVSVVTAVSMEAPFGLAPVFHFAHALDGLGILNFFGVDMPARHEALRAAKILHPAASIALVTVVLIHLSASNFGVYRRLTTVPQGASGSSDGASSGDGHARSSKV